MNKLLIGITTYNNVDNFAEIEKIYNSSEVAVRIVDDYSTDGLREKLNEKQITFETPIKKIGAPGCSRNMILEYAIAKNYEYVTFIDGDDAIIKENLIDNLKSLENSYDMCYSPMLTRGYNGLLIPSESANFEFCGELKKASLIEDDKVKLRKQLLMGSGGRIYNVKLINKHNLRYDPDKSGQDTLFNHQIFEHSKMIMFLDIAKPFYIYNIQTQSLSNNYSLDIMKGRLKLIKQIAQYPYAIHSCEEYATKSFHRYTRSYMMKEIDKIELVDTLSKFTNIEYTYSPSKNFLVENESHMRFERGLNIILIDCDLKLKSDPLFNIVKIEAFSTFEQIKKYLIYSKTIVLDKTVISIDEKFLKDSIDSNEDLIQPYYRLANGQAVHKLDEPIYHGYSPTGFVNTYTYVGMIFETRHLCKVEFSFGGYFEFLVKSMFLNNLIPLVVKTDNFVLSQRSITKRYSNAILRTYNCSFFANTRGMINPYSTLIENDIVPGTVVTKVKFNQIPMLTYEEQALIENQIQEFSGFDGWYIVDEENCLAGVVTSAETIDFSNLICMKRLKGKTNYKPNKVILNLPKNISIIE